jgi:ketosteroid isomerase-like protein
VSAPTNTQIIESVFEAFAQGDVPAILDRLSDDVRFSAHLEPVVPWAGSYEGKADVVGYFEALGASCEVLDHPVAELVSDGDTVVARGVVTFRARPTGRQASSAWVYVWQLRDQQVVSFEQFNDPELAGAFRP